MPRFSKLLDELEERSKEKSLRLFELFMKARNKKKAAEIWEMHTYGKISYEEALRRLRELARS